MKCPSEIERELLLPQFRIHPKMYSPALGQPVLDVMKFLKARGDEFIIISHPRTGLVIFTRQDPVSVDCKLRLVYVQRFHPTCDEDELTFEDWLRDLKEEQDCAQAHQFRFMHKTSRRTFPRILDDEDPLPA